MKRRALSENRAWIVALSLMSVLGICLVGVLVASVGMLFLRMNGMQPVSLHSPLHANYSADSRAIRFPVLNLSVIEEAIRDQASSTADPQEQLATVVVVLETPVPTITLYFTQPAPTQRTPTSPGNTATPKPPGITPSVVPTLTPTQTTTLTPTMTVTFKFTPTITLIPNKPTLTFTLTPKRTSTATKTPTRPVWITPTPTSTSTPIPSKTATYTPTVTEVPSFTPTNTQQPPPTSTPTPTPKPYPPPPTSYP